MEKQPRTLAADPNGRDWANLPSDVTHLIAGRVLSDDVAGLIRFRAACKPWRQCSPDPRVHDCMDHRFNPRKWIMLTGLMSETVRNFINTYTGERIRVDLPELAGHTLNRYPSVALEGLLVLRDNKTHVIRIFNPLTRQVTDLPPLTTLMRRWRMCMNFTEKYEITAAGFTDGSTVVLYIADVMRLATARPGDQRWRPFERCRSFISTVHFAGRFYFVNQAAAKVKVVDAKGSEPQLAVIAEKVKKSYGSWDTVNIVDCGGKLLVLCRGMDIVDSDRRNWKMKFSMFRVDLDARSMIPVDSLGNHAAFIGTEGTLIVSAEDFPFVTANTIYFCNGGLSSFCAYDVREGRTERYVPVKGSLAECFALYVICRDGK